MNSLKFFKNWTFIQKQYQWYHTMMKVSDECSNSGFQKISSWIEISQKFKFPKNLNLPKNWIYNKKNSFFRTDTPKSSTWYHAKHAERNSKQSGRWPHMSLDSIDKPSAIVHSSSDSKALTIGSTHGLAQHPLHITHPSHLREK